MTKRKPITPTEAALVLSYVAFAVARQVAHDLRTLWRLTAPDERY